MKVETRLDPPASETLVFVTITTANVLVQHAKCLALFHISMLANGYDEQYWTSSGH